MGLPFLSMRKPWTVAFGTALHPVTWSLAERRLQRTSNSEADHDLEDGASVAMAPPGPETFPLTATPAIPPLSAG
jgi:hypothetical protein